LLKTIPVFFQKRQEGRKLSARMAGEKAPTLIDVQFGEKCVQTMNLLFLLDISVELRDALQRQLIHQIDHLVIFQTILAEKTNFSVMLNTEGEPPRTYTE
jgi:hypothetical protein